LIYQIHQVVITWFPRTTRFAFRVNNSPIT
jgi:hypothetical protein